MSEPSAVNMSRAYIPRQTIPLRTSVARMLMVCPMDCSISGSQ